MSELLAYTGESIPRLTTSGNITLTYQDDDVAFLGSHGNYAVTAVLGILGRAVVFEGSNLDELMDSGDSLLILP